MSRATSKCSPTASPASAAGLTSPSAPTGSRTRSAGPSGPARSRRGFRDALHERLTQRFVDRRTAVLVRDIGARGADALPVTVAADGEVSVGPEPIGHLAGFDFRVDPNARLADKRMLLAAAERRLGDELDRRARGLIEADDDAFALTVEESGALAVTWEGHVLARLAPGRSLLEPALRTARALDRLSAHRRAALRARLETWLDRSIQHHLGPLKALARTAGDRQCDRRGARARRHAGRCRRGHPSPRGRGPDRRAQQGRPLCPRSPEGPARARSTSTCPRCSSPPPSIGARPCWRFAPARTCRACPTPAPPCWGATPTRAAPNWRSAASDRLAPGRPCRAPRRPRPPGARGRRRRPHRPGTGDFARDSTTKPSGG